MKRVVIVGRPNVGKSALLNRLAGRAVAIVYDQPGVTRDRISVLTDHHGQQFELIDTGGTGRVETPSTPREIAQAAERQAQIAMTAADVILMVVDGLEGLRPLDEELVAALRKSGKALYLVINKLDLPRHEESVGEFMRLGIDPVFLVSAAHGHGISSLWDALEAQSGGSKDPPQPEKVGRFTPLTSHAANPVPRIAVVGRPNVGKSSLVNCLLGDQRLIVSKIPGTTRDSVDLEVQSQGHRYVITDTAGIRQKRKIRSNVEMYSRHWAKRSIMGSDVVLLMLDAVDGPTRQDREIAGLILEHQKPCILLVNKWDLNEVVESISSKGPSQTSKTIPRKRRTVPRSEYEKWLRNAMPFLDYAPVLFISARQGYQVATIWKLVEQVCEARRTRFTTGALNRIFKRAQEQLPPPMRHGKRLKIYYATQKVGMPAPTFVLFINQCRLWIDNYARYLRNLLRKEYPLTGCPIIFEMREHDQAAGPGRNMPSKHRTVRTGRPSRGQ